MFLEYEPRSEGKPSGDVPKLGRAVAALEEVINRSR